MDVLHIELPTMNKLASDYINKQQLAKNFFHFQFDEASSYKQRLKYLSEREYKRTELVHKIDLFMKKYPRSEETERSLEKLRHPNSAVVIGGQQAGLLTGPLYSIYKIISIIQLAKQQQQELGIPVVPVFWIAGEDHDWQEVNHIFAYNGQLLEKKVIPQSVMDKRMVSDVGINKEIFKKWTLEVVEGLAETAYTKDLLQLANHSIDQSETFVDFFANLTMSLFKNYGLLIMDSGDHSLRELEKEYFLKMTKKTTCMVNALCKQQEELGEYGYKKMLEVEPEGANLFFYNQFERILLSYDSEKRLYIGKKGELQFSEEELLQLIMEHPEKFSNNVVSRPLMQEWLFPTLAFIAGPGEIAYWAELKKVFEVYNLSMPIIVPRLNITLLERAIERDIDELNLDLETILYHGTKAHQEALLDSVKDDHLEQLLEQTKMEFMNRYESIGEKALQIDKGLSGFLEKNESFIMGQFEFLQKKIEERLKVKHEVILTKYERIEISLRPFSGPQERTWNIFYFLNRYGMDFVDLLMTNTFTFDGKHIVIKI